MNHGAHTPDTEMLDESDMCTVCDGTGEDDNPRFPWQACKCAHCNGMGIEPLQSPEDYAAMVADEMNDQAKVEDLE